MKKRDVTVTVAEREYKLDKLVHAVELLERDEVTTIPDFDIESYLLKQNVIERTNRGVMRGPKYYEYHQAFMSKFYSCLYY